MPGIDGETLRAWRRSRGWDVPQMARELLRAAREAGQAVASQTGLIQMIYAWERGAHDISERYELLYRALGFSPDHLSRAEPAPREASVAARGTLKRSRLDALSPRSLMSSSAC